MKDKLLVAREARVRLAERDMSRAALARALGVSSSTVHYWMTGQRLVTPERQRQIAEVLGGGRSLFVAPERSA